MSARIGIVLLALLLSMTHERQNRNCAVGATAVHDTGRRWAAVLPSAWSDFAMMTFTYPNTETLAELAWRYGEQEFQRQPDPYSHNTFIFWDSSAITRWRVHTPRPWRRRREIMDATAAAILGGWETTR